MSRKVFITGATGYIGQVLAASLTRRGDDVTGLAREGSREGDVTRIVRGDILVPDSFASALQGVEILFHCAAHISFRRRDFENSFGTNVTGSRNVFEAAYRAGVHKVVHLSAGAVLGFAEDPDRAIDETSRPVIGPENVYAFTKAHAEQEAQRFVAKGLDVSIANIATVYGPGDRSLNSGGIIRSIYRGTLRILPPGGTSFVAAADLVDGLLLLAEKGRAGERYLFSTENMTFKELATRIARTLKVAPPRYVMPRMARWPALTAAAAMELLESVTGRGNALATRQIVRESFGYKYFNARKARKCLGWEPVNTFEETVKAAFDYYRKYNLI